MLKRDYDPERCELMCPRCGGHIDSRARLCLICRRIEQRKRAQKKAERDKLRKV